MSRSQSKETFETQASSRLNMTATIRAETPQNLSTTWHNMAQLGATWCNWSSILASSRIMQNLALALVMPHRFHVDPACVGLCINFSFALDQGRTCLRSTRKRMRCSSQKSCTFVEINAAKHCKDYCMAKLSFSNPRRTAKCNGWAPIVLPQG